MSILHLLNVGKGQCSVIQHSSGEATMIDICGGDFPALGREFKFQSRSHPVNPFDYLERQNIAAIDRFILSHPHIDHMTGIKTLFEKYHPRTFWDTDNTRQRPIFGEGQRFWQKDWDFYATLREGGNVQKTERLSLRDGRLERCQGETADEDEIKVLWPSKDGLDQANKTGASNALFYNDLSAVILYRSAGHKVLFTGDVPPSVWEPILSNYEREVADINILVSPHHGVWKDYSPKLMRVAKPVLTIVGPVGRAKRTICKLRDNDYQCLPTAWQSALIFELVPRQIRVYATNGRLGELGFRRDEHFGAYSMGPLARNVFQIPASLYWCPWNRGG